MRNLKWLNKQKFDEKRLNSKCEICKKTFYVLDIHHMDKNPRNNDPINYLFICRRCHRNVHTSSVEKCRRIKGRLLSTKKNYFLRKYHSLLKSSHGK